MDTKGLASRLIDAKMSDGGGKEPEVDTLHELLRDFHQALMSGDYAQAGSHFRAAQNFVDSEPHEEYGEEGEGYSTGGFATSSIKNLTDLKGRG
jgi:hypothetical protein